MSTSLCDEIQAMEIAAAIGEAVQGPPSPMGRAPYRPRSETCDKHGPYPVDTVIDGVIYAVNPAGCPKCIRSRGRRDLLASANIPPRFEQCTFDNYDASLPAQVEVLERCKRYARSFGTLRKRGTSLVLCGRKGTGKNHLATAIMKVLLADGYSVLRVKAQQFLDAYWGRSYDQRDDWIRELSLIDLLMIDELGRSSDTKGAQDAMFRLIDARSEEIRPTLITTNLTADGLQQFLGEALYDRLKEGGGRILSLSWDSHRGSNPSEADW